MSRLVTNPECPIYPAPLPGWVGHQDLSIIPRLTILNKMLPHSILSASFLRKGWHRATLHSVVLPR